MNRPQLPHRPVASNLRRIKTSHQSIRLGRSFQRALHHRFHRHSLATSTIQTIHWYWPTHLLGTIHPIHLLWMTTMASRARDAEPSVLHSPHRCTNYTIHAHPHPHDAFTTNLTPLHLILLHSQHRWPHPCYSENQEQLSGTFSHCFIDHLQENPLTVLKRLVACTSISSSATFLSVLDI